MKEPFSFYLLLTVLSNQGLIFLLGGFAILYLLALSAVISASESAYFSIPPHVLDRFRSGADKRHKLIASLLGRPRLLLISLLILKTIVDVTIITASVLLLWHALAGEIYNAWVIFSLLILCIVFLASATMIVPKIYGARHNVGIAQRTAYAWKIWIEILRPFSIFLIKVGKLLETRFQRDDNQAAGELNQALELATENTLTSEGDANFLRSIVNFGALTVAEVMRPREAVAAVNVDIGFQQLIEFVRTTGYARLPVYSKTLDSIVGVLYTKDLLPFIDEIGREYRWQYLIRPGFFVHETKRISSLLKDFQEKHVHMAIAINDARSMVGLVTLEDIVQEIIGNIREENIPSS